MPGFENHSQAAWDSQLANNLRTTFAASKVTVPHLRARGGGSIVNIASIAALMPSPQLLAYGAAKAGLNHMMRSIAVELSSHRINVNAIEPGWIDTPGEHVSFSDETMAAEGKKLPWGRLGLPDHAH